jgi:hypothetical protein
MKVFNSKIAYLLLFFVFIGCFNSINQINKNEDELYQNLKKGDITSYNDLKIIYLDYPPGDFIEIAKYASDSLNYKIASLDVFECYFNKYNFDYDSLHKVDLCKMSKNDRKDALLYLRKALKQKVQEAKYYSSLNKPNCND